MKNELIRKIVESVHPDKIILFGSYAYGQPSENSDLDLLVVLKDFNSKIEEKRRIRKALYDIKMPKDILVVKSDEFDFYKNESGSVIMEAAKKGITFYDKTI
jgi:predicted nucleotidyltransferase